MVNTGTDGRSDGATRPSFGDDDFPTGRDDGAAVQRTSWQRAQRVLVELRWPLLSCGLSLFLLSATTWYHLFGSAGSLTGPLQLTIAFLHDTFGWLPLLAFCLMVLGWSSIWFWSGRVERPGARFARLAIVLVMFGVFLNLGNTDGAVEPQRGALGMWIATRLVHVIGYVPSLLLVWSTTFAALMLATDFFWMDVFETLRRPQTPREAGVEDEVTEHLRGLAQMVPPPRREVPHNLRPLVAEGAPMSPPVVQHEAEGEAEAPAEARIEVDAAIEAPTAVEPSVEPPRPSSYEERRRLRRMRREWVEPEPEAAAEPEAAPLAEQQTAEPEPAEKEPADVQQPVEPVGDDEVSSGELAALFGELPAAEAAAEAPAPEEPEAAGPEPDAFEPAGRPPAAGRIDLLGEVADPDDGPELPRPEPLSGPEVDDAERTTEVLDDELDDDLRDDTAVEELEIVHAARRDTDEEPDDRPGEAPAAEAADDRIDEAEPADDRIDEDQPDEPAAATLAEPEHAVDIPRPDVPPAPRVPTPPATAQRPARQQQLFGGDDGLVDEAIEVVIDSRRATASLLQRKLRVDYSMACDLLAELAARGVIAIDDDATQGRVLDR